MSRLLRRALPVLLGVAAVVALVVVSAGLRARGVERDLREARGLIDDADAALDDDRVGDARASLTRAQQLLTSANSDLYGRLELDLIGVVPGVSHNLRALRDSVGLALTMVDGGGRILEQAAALEREDGTIEVPFESGAIPLGAVVAAQREIDALAGSLPGPDEEPSRRFLLPQVAEARSDLLDEAQRRRDQLDVLSRGLEVLSDMAGGNGDRRYLLAVANTAEMRGTGGMILNYGVLDGRDGDFELSAFGRIDELLLEQPVPAEESGLPEDYLARWEGFDVRQRWRNANVAADFTLVAPFLEQMYTAATDLPVDGVIQIDPQGLAAVLEGIGPVLVEGLGAVDADNVVDLTLNTAYRVFPDIESRSDVLGDVAEAVFTSLLEGRYDSLRPLADAIVRTVEGRHVLVHADQRAVQDQSRFFGADGGLLDPATVDSVVLTVQNTNATKLDYYLDTAMTITGDRPADDVGSLAVAVTLTNTAPPGESTPQYIFGPFQEAGAPGRYRGIVSLYLPRGATITASDGFSTTTPQVFTEGGRTVVSYVTEVDAGSATTLTMQLTVPPPPTGAATLILQPTPRVRSTTVVVDVSTGGTGGLTASATLERALLLRPGDDAAPLPTGLVSLRGSG